MQGTQRRRNNYSMINVQEVPKDSTERQNYFLNKAAQLAIRSNLNHRHGCVVVNGQTNEIISTGFNHTSEHMFHSFSMHAEIDALRKIKKNVDLTTAEMYVVRIGPESLGNPLKLSKPCEGCAKQILKVSIGKVYYSWSDIDYDPKSINKYKYDIHRL